MAKAETRSKTAIRLAASKRLLMWHLLSQRLDLVLLTEFPKSGGTWLSNLISTYLNLPFPQNESAKLERSLLHGHHLYNSKFNNLICLNRDGRDTMVSFYFHMFSGMDEIKSSVVDNFKKDFGFDDFQNSKKNLPKYIEYMFTKYNQARFRFSWSEFVRSFYGKEDVIYVKYEELLSNPHLALSHVLSNLITEEIDNNKLDNVIQQFSFANQTKRKPGQEDKKSFLRKGVAGDWKNHFSKEACQVFDYYAGKELIYLGYEKDHNWY